MNNGGRFGRLSNCLLHGCLGSGDDLANWVWKGGGSWECILACDGFAVGLSFETVSGISVFVEFEKVEMIRV
jgi:hypothetical protein